MLWFDASIPATRASVVQMRGSSGEVNDIPIDHLVEVH